MFENNTVTQIGITYTNCADVVIRGNTLTNSVGAAIWSSSAYFSNMTVSANVIVTPSTGNRIPLFNVSSGVISGNIVSGSSTSNGVAVLDSNNVVISRNTTSNNAASGIVLVRCSDVCVIREHHPQQHGQRQQSGWFDNP